MRLSLGVIMLVAAGHASAGVTLTFERTRRSFPGVAADKAQTLTMRVEGARCRIEDSASVAGYSVLLWDGVARQLTGLEVDAKVYSRVGEPQRAKASEAKAVMRQQQQAKTDEAVAKLPPELRAKLKDHPPAAAPVEIRATASRRKISGFDCQVYERTQSQASDEEVCVVPWADVKVTAADLEPLRALADFLDQNSGGPPENAIDEAAKYAGLPVQTVLLDGAGRPLRTLTLVKIDAAKLPPSLFEVPAGYAEKAPPR